MAMKDAPASGNIEGLLHVEMDEWGLRQFACLDLVPYDWERSAQ